MASSASIVQVQSNVLSHKHTWVGEISCKSSVDRFMRSVHRGDNQNKKNPHIYTLYLMSLSTECTQSELPTITTIISLGCQYLSYPIIIISTA